MNSTHIVRRRGKFLAPSAGRGLASRLKGNCDAYYVVRAQVLRVGVFPAGEPCHSLRRRNTRRYLSVWIKIKPNVGTENTSTATNKRGFGGRMTL